MNRPFTVQALGEVAIHCHDFDAMIAFYEHIIGLERLRPGERGGYEGEIVFFKFGESSGGHLSVLALFSKNMTKQFTDNPSDKLSAEQNHNSSLHHFALSLPWAEQQAAIEWLGHHGCKVKVVDFDWVGWRGVFTQDPDGNTVELVAASPDWHLT